MKKRILITGANGMLGGTLAQLFQQDYEVFATGTRKNGLDYFYNYKQFDLKSQSYEELIKWSNPNIVLHCAAITCGNYCQNNPLEAFEVNGISIKKFADSVGADVHFLYISTDAVFPSELHMASEMDFTSPENIYGKSKEIGEFFLLNSELNFTIIRTTIVGLNFDPSKIGFVEWIIDAAKTKNEISLFDDVLFSPISIWDLAKQLEHLFGSKSKYLKKVLHIAGTKPCTKYEFGIALLAALELPQKQVLPGSIAKMAGRAKRSTNQSLNSTYYEKLSGRKLPDLTTTILSIKENYKYYEKH